MQIEMTEDGEKWEVVDLPPNCLPFHQVRWFGTFSDDSHGVIYRKKEKQS